MDSSTTDMNARIAQRRDRVSRWYVLVLLVIGYAIYNLDKSIVSILIEPLKAEFGLSDSKIGLLTGIVTSVPFAVACLPIGMLADRFNRKRLLMLLVAGWSGMTALCGLASNATLLFGARAGVGGFEAGYTPVSMSILCDSFPRRQRATAMGLFSLGAPLGVFLGLAMGGFVAAAYGWRAAFWIAGIPGLALALLIGLSMREPIRGRFDASGEQEQPAPLGVAITNIWRDRALFHVSAGMTCGAIVLATLAVWTPSFLIRAHGFQVHDAGLAAALVVGLCGASGAAAGGALSDRLARKHESRRLLMPIIGPLVSISFALVALLVVDRGDVALVLLAPAAFFGQFYIGAGYAMATSLAQTRMRGTTMAVLLILFNIVSNNIGTMLVGFVSDTFRPEFGARSISVGMAATCVFSVLASLFFWRAKRIVEARAATGI